MLVCLLSFTIIHLADFLDHIGNIPLWSNVETAIGLILGSVPALHQFFGRHRKPKSSTHESDGLHPSLGLVTIGGTDMAAKSKERKTTKSSNYEADENGQGDWTRLDEDTASDKESTVPIRGIRKDVSFEMDANKHR